MTIACEPLFLYANPHAKKPKSPESSEWVIEGSGESPDLSQLPRIELIEPPTPSDADFLTEGSRSALRLILRDTADLDGGTALPESTWNLSADGYISPPMSQP